MVPFPAGLLSFMTRGFFSFLEDTIWSGNKYTFIFIAINVNATAFQ